MTWTSIDFPELPRGNRAKVKALITQRNDGVSADGFASFNLASHVGDDPAAVMTNRAILRHEVPLPSEPYWLHQTHSAQSVELPYEYRPDMPCDASYTSLVGKVCAVMTADCLPLLICNRAATEVAAIHAGWRGLAGGIIESTIKRMRTPAHELHVFLGPAIGPQAFEVGSDVKAAFINESPSLESCFTNKPQEGKFNCNIYQIARHKLTNLNVAYVGGGEECTYSQADDYFSYRRDGQTGRMASLIWLQP